jgi:hypothetical protein
MTLACPADIEIHEEHLTLLEELVQLDRGLDRLECYSEVFANLAGAEQVKDFGRRLAEQLPEHFQREEETILAAASQVSPELKELCSELAGEHAELLGRLARFRSALEELDKAEDIDQAVWHLKGAGRELTNYLREHVIREENELSGFL